MHTVLDGAFRCKHPRGLRQASPRFERQWKVTAVVHMDGVDLIQRCRQQTRCDEMQCFPHCAIVPQLNSQWHVNRLARSHIDCDQAARHSSECVEVAQRLKMALIVSRVQRKVWVECSHKRSHGFFRAGRGSCRRRRVNERRCSRQSKTLTLV